MKICMCADTYKRLLKWARKGGLKGALKIIRTKKKVPSSLLFHNNAFNLPLLTSIQ